MTDWMREAACAPDNLPPGVDYTLWTDPPPPEKGNHRQWGTGAQRDAIEICRTCPVWQDCLQTALTWEARDRAGRNGIWGGTTPAERARIARRAQMKGRRVA